MIEIYLLIISATFSYFLTKYFIKYLKALGITSYDVHKKIKKKIPEGGLSVVFAFIICIFIWVGYNTFISNQQIKNTGTIFAGTLTILLITLVGFLDDLLRKTGWKKGLKKWEKPLFTTIAALPLMVISAGVSTMNLPLIGTIDFGVFYPLVIIPTLVIGIANAINILGGFNGLEAGMGIISFLSLFIFSTINNLTLASIFSISALGALIGFFILNKYPAKIFGGDSLTYFIGGTLATIIIIGNIEKFGIILLIPWIIEITLKLRSKLKAECFGELQEDGTIKYSGKIYSLTHLVMKIGNFKEWQITLIFIILQSLVSILAFWLTLFV